jgi:hypothetical protein
MLKVTQQISNPLEDITTSYFEFISSKSKFERYYFQKLIFSLNCLNEILEQNVLEDIQTEVAKEELLLFNSFSTVLKQFFNLLKKNSLIELGLKNELIIRFYKVLHSIAEIIQTLELFAREDEDKEEEEIKTLVEFVHSDY